MIEIAGAALCGLGIGAIFAFARLPVPAPPTIAGVAGILGITLGWQLVGWWLR